MQGRKKVWLAISSIPRWVAFVISSGVDCEGARNAASAIGTRLPLPGLDEEEAMLKRPTISESNRPVAVYLVNSTEAISTGSLSGLFCQCPSAASSTTFFS
jgi:hypothetical protein